MIELLCDHFICHILTVTLNANYLCLHIQKKKRDPLKHKTLQCWIDICIIQKIIVLMDKKAKNFDWSNTTNNQQTCYIINKRKIRVHFIRKKRRINLARARQGKNKIRKLITAHYYKPREAESFDEHFYLLNEGLCGCVRSEKQKIYIPERA